MDEISLTTESTECDVLSGVNLGMLLSSPVIKRVNLDITTLISLVSNVCHGRCQFVFKEEILSLQAEEERKDPLIPRLRKFINGEGI